MSGYGFRVNRLLTLRIVMQCRLSAAGTAACGRTRADVPSAANPDYSWPNTNPKRKRGQ